MKLKAVIWLTAFLAAGILLLHGSDGEAGNGKLSFGIAAASHDLDGFWVNQYQAGILPMIRINQDLVCSVAIMGTKVADRDLWLLDAGARISWYPVEQRFWIGMSVLQNLTLHGEDIPEETHFFMQELSMGYTFMLGDHFFIDTYAVMRDPFDRHEDAMVSLVDWFPSFTRFELGIKIGGYFLNVLL